MGTSAGRSAEAADDAATGNCDIGPGSPERITAGDITAGITPDITADVAVIGGGVICGSGCTACSCAHEKFLPYAGTSRIRSSGRL